ncbi:hypothetical protein M2116_001128 [Aurantimicrobium minutum]|uniref:hypothetical protein n=1 Tax=Aurantimicrobium minutum TaxID=708131 RepID=UPI0024066972|nr:hypothetical protein [Aurantimicrobium minutum]MDF9810167.1 hypothetical protein [Aurantimicrobium minutum]
MPDTRLPERWILNPVYRDLTDTDWRVYTWGLMFSNDQLTDGHITASALGLLHPEGLQPESYERLVKAGLWDQVPKGGYVSTNWNETQTTKEQFLAQRESAKVRKQRQRSRQAISTVTPSVTRDVQGEDKAKAEDKEQDKAQEEIDIPVANPNTGEVMEWEVATIPVSDLVDSEPF